MTEPTERMFSIKSAAAEMSTDKRSKSPVTPSPASSTLPCAERKVTVPVPMLSLALAKPPVAIWCELAAWSTVKV